VLSGEGNGYGYGHERVGAAVPGRVGAAAGVGQLGIRIPQLKLSFVSTSPGGAADVT
jgi:hypothetical protein